MRIEAIHHAGNAAQLWMLSVAVLFVANANASGSGDIQANGNPGGMDKAQIALRVAAPMPGETKPAAIKKPGVHNISGKKKIRSSDKLSLSLSMTLSIPGNEPVRPRNSTKTGEALQPDSIAKEKTLSVLSAQIAEMEQMIKAQQSQLGISTNQSDSRVAPGILHLSTRPFDLKYNAASHAVDAELACDREHPILVFGDAVRFESQSGEVLHVEKVCALQVRIALRVAGVDGGGFDRDLGS